MNKPVTELAERRKGKISIEIQRRTETFPVYSQRLAGYLMQKGFVLVSMEPNIKNRHRNVYFFWRSPEIDEEINKYLGR